MFHDEDLNWASFCVLRHAACVGTIIALSSTALHLPPALSVKLLKRLEWKKFLLACYVLLLFIRWGKLFFQKLICFWSANNAVVLIGLRPQVE